MIETRVAELLRQRRRLVCALAAERSPNYQEPIRRQIALIERQIEILRART